MGDSEEHIRMADVRWEHHMKMTEVAEQYAAERDQLLAAERENTWDSKARSTASSMEIRAGKIISTIREHERIDPELYGNLPGEKMPKSSTRDMGGRFLSNKPRIESSKLFRIAEEMPKGAHLHLHFNAVLHPSELLLYARRPEMANTMFIRSSRPLLKGIDFEQAEIVFGWHPKEINVGNIFSPNYDPEWKLLSSTAWMRWIDFRRHYNLHVKAKEHDAKGVSAETHSGKAPLDAAERWACQKIVIAASDVHNERQTTNGIWACFNQRTRALKGLLSYEGAYRWYIGSVIDELIDDKVMYAELRPMLLDKTISSDDGTRQLDHRAQMSIICEEVENKLIDLKERNRLDIFPFGIKIIYCTPRSISRSTMQTELQDCLRLKLHFPDLICGFDLVGAEDRKNNIGHYADLLLAFTNTCKDLKISIPFMFHAGETLLDRGGSHDPDNSNLYDALLLNSKRIGHGYALLKHPLLLEQYKAKSICLELCPISNEILHLCGNARQHVFPELLASGLHCTLNADNPGLFR
jgi:adenosine deaminase CECR1